MKIRSQPLISLIWHSRYHFYLLTDRINLERESGEDLVLQREVPGTDQMPSLKMKTKSTAGCIREKNGLCICQTSMISKNCPSHDRISQQEADLETCNQNKGNKEDLYVSSPRVDDSDENDRSSCEYQTSNESDFISDVVFSEIPIKSHYVYDFNEITSFLDYKCYDEPSTCLDEEIMFLPFLEDTLETSNGCDGRLCEDTVIDSVDSSLFISIHQLKSYNQESDVNTYQNCDQAECMDLDLFITDVAPNPWHAKVMPMGTCQKKSTTLVLDLDETLVHSTLDHRVDADFTFPVFINMEEHTVYVKQRPYLHTFLERVADMFEIIVFTASQSIYAKQLLDILDPEQNIISRRAYRESCIFADGSYTKDLTVLGVDLAKIAIIDNSPQVFRLQVNNGIPIKSWFDDPSDSALITLLPFLEILVDVEDVRPIIAKKFGNME